jgi:hypothetical protein
VRFHREQEIAEAAERVWADRLAFHRHRVEAGVVLVDGDREVIGPESHHALLETVRRSGGQVPARAGFGTQIGTEYVAQRRVGLLRARTRRCCALHRAFAAERLLAHEIVRTGRQRAGRNLDRASRLFEQPSARIVDRSEFAGTRAEAETVACARRALSLE